jgi:hypothetical protein
LFKIFHTRSFYLLATTSEKPKNAFPGQLSSVLELLQRFPSLGQPIGTRLRICHPFQEGRAWLSLLLLKLLAESLEEAD